MILSDRAVLPLTGSTFEPGNAEKVIKEMEDKELISLIEEYKEIEEDECFLDILKEKLKQLLKIFLYNI